MSDPQHDELNQQVGATPGTADLEAMTKDELLAYAGQVGAKVKPAMSKGEIIQIISETQSAVSGIGDSSEATPIAGAEEQISAASVSETDEKGNEETDEAMVGTIRIQDGVEQVKVGPNKWVPTIREEIVCDKPVVLFSKARAGKTVFGRTGKAIVFDETGKATVSAIDWLYLKNLPNYSLTEGA